MFTRSLRSNWRSVCWLGLAGAAIAIASGGHEADSVRAGEAAKSSAATNGRPAPTQRDQRDGEKTKRLREGTVVTELLGTFRSAGESYWFRQASDGRDFRVLENLALERISRTLPDLPTNRTWSVNGTVTEYQGENYLLVTRAVLKSHVDRTGMLQPGE